MQAKRIRLFRFLAINRPRSTIRSRGFTLIELLVVIAILVLLAGIVGPRVMKTFSSSKTKTAHLQIEELAGSLDIYRLDVGHYPTTAEGLQALVENPSDAKGWNGPYLKKSKVPTDPWGFDYEYRSPGEHGSFDLLSLGADNREGGEGEDQDVVSWE